MNHHELLDFLAASPDSSITFRLPDGGSIPAHFHVTEVGHVRKDFIDCGGAIRSLETCLLQAWIADDDEDHRIETSKPARIIRLAAPLLGGDGLPVEVEYESGYVSQFPIESAEATPQGVVLHLTTKHTDCLARESCGLSVADESECCC